MTRQTRRERALDLLASNDRVSPLAERVGARALSDQIDRMVYDGDVVAVQLPLRPSDVRSKRIKMFRQHGTDQIARAFHDGGWRGYEHPVPTMFRGCVDRSTGLVFDVGANTGVYALVAAATGRTVHALEPSRDIAALLRANVRLNRQEGRITVVEVAASDRDGRAQLFIPPPTTNTIETSASLDPAFLTDGVEDPSYKRRHAASLDVTTTTLDVYWRRLGSPPVGIVKIDVEGHEAAVLAGATELTKSCQPVIFLEVLRDAGRINDFKERFDYVDVRLSAVEAVFGDVVKYDPLGWNHILIPIEWIEAVKHMVRSSDLILTVPT
ncbi:MAG TPA: FkbM family methyltransferase [Acidimicrobiales bacterium]